MSNQYRLFIVILIILNLLLGGVEAQGEGDRTVSLAAASSQCEVVILADPDDPYYPLAQEIAAAENAPLAHSLDEATACNPVFLIWVVSPAFLSDPVMIEFGQVMKAQATAISSGLITGSTIAKARSLWERRTQVRSEKNYAVNAANPAAHIDAGRIIGFAQEQKFTQPLTKTAFLDVLQTADYLTFTGHGGNRYLRIDEDTQVVFTDVPALDSVVVETGSCQTVRPWNADSIALRMVDQGAAAYSGFVFSPNEGYLIGEFDGLPFRYTWRDFPIGLVIQAQNRGTLLGFAAFPYQFLLGDPRIAFQPEPPYALVEDRLERDWRILTFRDVPAGAVPIRISDGAAYWFVEVQGITAASEQDPFYNSRLQMVNIQKDKFILLVYEGGDLTLRLRLRAPWYWRVGDILLDSLDDTLIYNPQTGGDILAIVFLVFPLAWTGWQIFRKRLTWQKVHLAAAFGLGAVLLHGMYILFRLDRVTIISKDVAFSPLSLVATLGLGICGALIYFQSRSRFGKVIALLVVTFMIWSPAAFGLIMVAVLNNFFFIPKAGAALYNYSLGLLPVSAFVLTFLLSGLVLGRIVKSRFLLLPGGTGTRRSPQMPLADQEVPRQ